MENQRRVNELNTRLSYHYADKTNCRQYNVVVVAGTITWEQIESNLAARRSFIPGQIGLEDLQYRFALPGRDHPWHQIAPEDIRPTEAAPTIVLTAEELAERFASRPWAASQIVASELERTTSANRRTPARGAYAREDSTTKPGPADPASISAQSISTRSRKLGDRTK
jgi:hypothetical protein